MIAANFSEFQDKLEQLLRYVEEKNDTLIVKRESSEGVVVLSLEEYNSIMETMHLLSSKKNTERLQESLQQMKNEKPSKS